MEGGSWSCGHPCYSRSCKAGGKTLLGRGLCKSTRLLLAASTGGDTWLLQTRLALLEQCKHTNNTPIASGDSGGETPLTSLAAKAVLVGVIFAVAVRGLCVGRRRMLRVLFTSEKERWTFSRA